MESSAAQRRLAAVSSHLCTEKCSGGKVETILGPTSNYFISQRLRLHYVDWGNHGKPILILVHGGRDHCRNWDWVAKELRDYYHIVAPDLRGHGDSEWCKGGEYLIPELAFDLSNLIDALTSGSVTIMAHSLGGAVSLSYTGLFPERVNNLILVEGIGAPPHIMREWMKKDQFERLRDWMDQLKDLAQRKVKKYANIEEAENRMKEENPFLSVEQAHHLTVHGVARNEDGTYSWKFDNYNRIFFPQKYDANESARLNQRVECPVLLIQGTESWMGDPVKDGRVKEFRNVKSVNIEKSGHWCHHDNFDQFMHIVKSYLLKNE